MWSVLVGVRRAFQAEPTPGPELTASTSELTDDATVPVPNRNDAPHSWVTRLLDTTDRTSPMASSPTGASVAAEVETQAARTATPADLGLVSSFVSVPTGEPIPALPTAVCVDGTDASDLTGLFDRREPMLGADYQRAYPLPSGRVLWLFQDAFLATAGGPELVHNVGLLQSGSCFQLLRNGTAAHPLPYLLPELTDRFDRWFWPMGGEVGVDALLHVFVVEMHEQSSSYLERTVPVATWLVDIDPDDLRVVAARPAPDDSDALYGWSVVSDEQYTYLYAHCYRQYGWDPLWFAPDVLAHDYSCSADVTVARVPRGVLSATPEYWDGSGWHADRTSAAPVIPTEGRPVNPTQVVRWNGMFVAATKVGDWWGDQIVLDVAPAATGPWTTYATVEVVPECDGCNTYFASIVPYGADESSFVVGLSCNTWTGVCTEHYTPTFLRVPTPS
jgi:hypothetical protein